MNVYSIVHISCSGIQGNAEASLQALFLSGESQKQDRCLLMHSHFPGNIPTYPKEAYVSGVVNFGRTPPLKEYGVLQLNTIACNGITRSLGVSLYFMFCD